ncbi:MAG: 4-hydroxyphenylpyruvate dioxygenase [Candidatus Marinimicrobia bacterium]|nr:4-hydroxyphenylpyruvate dioxygenase [Candidatus Neomarinimicrobiota bacterium]
MTQSNIETVADPQTTEIDIPIHGTDHVEMYVGNAKQAMHFFCSGFGFRPVAYRGPETGVKDTASYVVEQGKVRIVITSPLGPDSPIADHVHRHGDGVKDIALWVDDAAAAFDQTVKNGAIPIAEPTEEYGDGGKILKATVGTYGETQHTFIQRDEFEGTFLPGYEEYGLEDWKINETNLEFVDHIVGNVEDGKMNDWAEYYESCFGFHVLQNFDEKDISTKYSSLRSRVMKNANGRIKLPINEPAEGLKKSQIQEYLDYYKSPGVQHVALHTNDIIQAVDRLRTNGIKFLQVPDSYYENLLDRVGDIDEDIEVLKDLHVLVDRDEQGYLLQLFTKPVEDRPTLFFEVIQRKGSQGFGKGNFKALFEAIEYEQQKRGNL